MKLYHFVLLNALFFCGCANQPSPTPEQLAAYGQLIHGAVHDGVQDYKTIKSIK